MLGMFDKNVSRFDRNVSRHVGRVTAEIAEEIQQIIRQFVAFEGTRTRGIAAFARLVGVTERRARSLYEGTAGRIDAAEHALALAARNDLSKRRAQRLRAELASLESLEIPHAAETVAGPRPGTVLAGR